MRSLGVAVSLILTGCVLDGSSAPDARSYPGEDAARDPGFRDAGCGGGGPSGGSGGGSGLGCGGGSGAPTPDAAPACTLVDFQYSGAATSVWVSGTFTSPPWAPMPPNALAMAPDGAGGWALSAVLPPGTHHYKLILDGEQWIIDPANPLTEDDGDGNQNSVLEVCSVQ